MAARRYVYTTLLFMPLFGVRALAHFLLLFLRGAWRAVVCSDTTLL